jgi:DNA-binding IclR family transcriptional regulator
MADERGGNGGTNLLSTGLKILHVVDTVADFKDGVGVSELAKVLGWSRNVTHQYLTTGVAADWLVQGENQKYHVGFHAAVVARNASPHGRIRPLLLAEMSEMVELVNAPVSYAVLDKGRPIIVDRVEPDRAIQVRGGLESRVSLRTSASGQVFLAHTPELIPAGALDLADEEVQQAIRRVHEHGASKVRSRWRGDEIVAVAAPVFLRGQCVGALSVIMPAARTDDDKVEAVLIDRAASVNQQLLEQQNGMREW